MNCPNCGAPLNDSHKCEYCGSEFSTASGDVNNIILKLNDEVITCYVQKIDADIIPSMSCGRDIHGRIVKSKPVVRRTFILKEL